MYKESITKKKRQIEKDLRDYQDNILKEYKDTVYYPQLKALREECEENGGHNKGQYHNNGLGCEWYYCSYCGARHSINEYN